MSVWRCCGVHELVVNLTPYFTFCEFTVQYDFWCFFSPYYEKATYLKNIVIFMVVILDCLVTLNSLQSESNLPFTLFFMFSTNLFRTWTQKHAVELLGWAGWGCTKRNKWGLMRYLILRHLVEYFQGPKKA